MKKLIFAVTILLLIVGVAMAKSYEVAKKAGDYSVIVRMDKNPPITGGNNMSAVIKDAAGVEVRDAKVSVEYSMPAMPGMPAMSYKANTVLKGSEYQAKLNFSMSGSWNMIIKITRGGKISRAKFNVDVR